MVADPVFVNTRPLTMPCIEWWGSVSSNGYGRLRRHDYAHRHIYEQCFGPIPEGFVIDHLCRNRRCVNPEHLEAVPERVNLLRGTGVTAGYARLNDRCSRGHSLANAYVRPDNGGRMCRPCLYARTDRYRRRRLATGRTQ